MGLEGRGQQERLTRESEPGRCWVRRWRHCLRTPHARTCFDICRTGPTAGPMHTHCTCDLSTASCEDCGGFCLDLLRVSARPIKQCVAVTSSMGHLPSRSLRAGGYRHDPRNKAKSLWSMSSSWCSNQCKYHGGNETTVSACL